MKIPGNYVWINSLKNPLRNSKSYLYGKCHEKMHEGIPGEQSEELSLEFL